MKQTALTLPITPSFARADFVISECNAHALEQLDAWPNWPAYGLLLMGAPASGKTHLARIWQEKSGAKICSPNSDVVAAMDQHVLVDDADEWQGEASEIKLFHLLNQTKEQGKHILLTSSSAPATWNHTLADLRSRLNSLPQITLQTPDDHLLAAVLTKHFSDRQVLVEANVVDFIATRVERSFSALQEIVSKLDRIALQEKRAITIPLAKPLFEKE